MSGGWFCCRPNSIYAVHCWRRECRFGESKIGKREARKSGATERSAVGSMIDRPRVRARSKHDGALTAAEIAEALQKCSDAAYDLYDSANTLVHHGRVSTASGLLVLALEEYGRLGWLYLSLMLPEDDEESWGKFWYGFYTHTLKAEVAHEMMLARHSLLPLVTRFFRHDIFSFSNSSGKLGEEKQNVLYLSYDKATRRFISPRDRVIDLRGLHDTVNTLVLYAAKNQQAHVFYPSVVEEFRVLNLLAGHDEGLRVRLLRLFYRDVLRDTPALGERDLNQVEREVRSAIGEKAQTLIERWRAVGSSLGPKTGLTADPEGLETVRSLLSKT